MDSLSALRSMVSMSCATEASEVAERLVETACALLVAPVGVAVLLDPAGTPSAVVHRGISVEELSRLPHLPSPVGLISVVLAGTALRLDDLSADPRSAGLLDALEMQRLLAAPLWVENRVVGAIFLARRDDEPGFEPVAEEKMAELCLMAAARLGSLPSLVRRAGQRPRGGAGADGPGLDSDHRPASGPRSDVRDGAVPWHPPGQHLVHLQPIVALDTCRTVGYEALSRFPDPGGTFRSPEAVFDEADRAGHGVELEHRALALALESLPLLPTDSYLSVNLSPQALLAPAVFAALSDSLRSHPGRLVVELTEHAEVLHYPTLVDTLTSLRAWGLRLAIDDMGSGFSSLRHVTMLHPDVIKLDREFISDIHVHRDRRAVARAIIAFAAEIGASFVAEGVETQAELQELRAMGAGFGQGYLLGRPAPLPLAQV